MDFVNDDGENMCPLCAEEMDLTDRQLKPCQCGYEICVLCWHHLMEVAEKDNTEGRCPACRTPYDKEKIVGTAVNYERLKDANSEKRQKSQKSKSKTSEMRKHLSNVRVIQRNLVYIVGIPASLADEEILERREFFGRYGKVLKVSISRSNASSQQSTSNPTTSVYITYVKEEEALRCIQAVNGFVLDGRQLRACFGTTKYCHAWLKSMPCNNPDCLYLHDIGTQEDSFTKEEMVSPCTSKIQQFHGPTNPSQRRGGSCLPPPEPDVSSTNSTSSSKPSVKMAPSVRIAVPNGTTGKATVLPAAASWGSRAAQGRTLPTKAPVIPVSAKFKSSSLHTLSVSPPSSLPSSAAAVAAGAAAPVLHSDQSKPSLLALSGNAAQSSERSACPVPSKPNVLKNPYTTRTNLSTSAVVDVSAAISTSERYISRQTSPQKKFAGSNPHPKSGVQESIERASHKLLSNLALPVNSHLEGDVETERSDCISVSSETIERRLCNDALKTIPDDYDEVHTLVSDENCERSDSHIHTTKHPFDMPTSCSNSLLIDNKDDLETSTVASIKNVCIMDSEDLCHPKELEEHSDSFVQIPSETRRKGKHEPASEDNKRHLGSQASNIVPVVSSPAGGTMIIGAPHFVSLNDRDISTASPIKASNLDIPNSDDYRTGMVDDRIEGFSSTGLISTICSAPPCKESSMDKDRISTGSLQASEQDYEDRFRIEKSKCLENLQKDQSSTRNNMDTDAGESSIISNILSMNFDIWEDNSIASPHNLAKVLLGEKDMKSGFPKDTSSSWKFQNSGQSRFSFAREDESKNESSNFSSSLTSNGQLQNTWLKGREASDGRNGYDQLNTSLNDASACNRGEFQIFTNRYTSMPSSESIVAPISSSRSQFSAPPGFSVPTRIPPVPPPGFSPQLRSDRPYESTAGSVFPNGTQDHDTSAAFQNTYSNPYSLLHQSLGNSNNSNDIEFNDPAIMAVGRGKLPLGQNQPVSAASYDSVFPMQDLANSNFSQSLLGFRNSFSGQASPGDYDARLQLLKQKTFYANANMAASRQQLKFQDQFGDAFASYLSHQNDGMMSSRMMDQAQMQLDSPFSQISFQQPVNSTFRNSSVGTNGWDSRNRISSALESSLSGRRLEASLAEIASKERMGLLDHKSGLSKIFPSYNEPKFHMPSSEDYYSRPFEM
jgi:CCR4-NOT transcription complex subunit 4